MAQTNTNSKGRASSSKSINNDTITAYENAKEFIKKQIEILKKEMNRTEIEWLNLCHLAQKSKSATVNREPGAPLFKDADELNAVPLTLESTDTNPTLKQFEENEEELSDDGYT